MAEFIRVTFKDGTFRDFKPVGRAGGSYTLSRRYDGAFIVIVDEYSNETAFPASDVKEVYVDSGTRGRW